MKLVEFRIEMYKSIVDSGWVKVNDLTVLVGKNEVGKTSLLRGLHKFNPFHPDPYDPAREWPRGKRDQKSDQQVVCRVRFKMDQENAKLSEITGKPINLDILEITKNYAGEFEVCFPEELFPDRLHPNDIYKAMEKLPELPEAVSSSFATEAGVLADETRRLAAEGRFTELTNLADAASARLMAVRIDANTQPQHQNETQYIEQLSAALRAIVQKLQKTETVQQKAHDYWIIAALSALAGRSEKQMLPDDVLITPAGGASEVTYIATFMVGQELGVVALYDTDESGTTAKDKFVKKWLARYHDRPAAALALGEIWKLSSEASIEDLFPDDFYLGYPRFGVQRVACPVCTSRCTSFSYPTAAPTSAGRTQRLAPCSLLTSCDVREQLLTSHQNPPTDADATQPTSFPLSLQRRAMHTKHPCYLAKRHDRWQPIQRARRRSCQHGACVTVLLRVIHRHGLLATRVGIGQGRFTSSLATVIRREDYASCVRRSPIKPKLITASLDAML